MATSRSDRPRAQRSQAQLTGTGPSPAELAAIVVAVEVAWPRPVPEDETPDRQPAARWRFSGRRWWQRRLPSGRRSW